MHDPVLGDVSVRTNVDMDLVERCREFVLAVIDFEPWFGRRMGWKMETADNSIRVTMEYRGLSRAFSEVVIFPINSELLGAEDYVKQRYREALGHLRRRAIDAPVGVMKERTVT